MSANDNLLLAGLAVIERSPGRVTLALPTSASAAGPGGAVSRGLLFLLADSAMEIVTNEAGRRSVAQLCDIAYLREAWPGDRLLAKAVAEPAIDRKGVCDVEVVRDDGALIARFRGHTRDV